MRCRFRTWAATWALCLAFLLPGPARSQDAGNPQDRGPGLATSMFGTYIEKGDLLIYPFFEYYLDDNLEYEPADMGYALAQDFRGRYTASEGIFFLGYGITDWLAVEFEAAVISARLEKAADDPSTMPSEIKESGLGDVEGQVRWRWMKEDLQRPELFSYFEAVSPQSKNKPLTGTPDWEYKLGFGVIRGFSWGTMTARAAGEYLAETSSTGPGEFAIEYLRRLSPHWHLYTGIEGVEDEVSLIAEAQWHVNKNVVVKLNNGFGITSKATDFSPEVGVMFRIPTSRP